MNGVDLQPNLYRVSCGVLFIALMSNFLLIWVARDPDAFVYVVAIASLVCAAAIAATALIPALIQLREEAFILAIAVWVANTLEFASLDGPGVDSKLRSCGLYMAFAILAAGTYIAQHLERVDTD